LDYLQRHVSGDWGIADDRRENETTIIIHMRIMSVYLLKSGVRIWIITEVDRWTAPWLDPHRAYRPSFLS
jgi:hypothetical protein